MKRHCFRYDQLLLVTAALAVFVLAVLASAGHWSPASRVSPPRALYTSTPTPDLLLNGVPRWWATPSAAPHG